MLGQNATHANFSVNDLAAAKQFYVDTLGFSAKKEFDGGLMLESGQGTRINIYEKADHTPWDATVLGVEVDDVKAALDELAAKGITAEKIAGTDEAGIMTDLKMGQAAWIKDPAGNWICIGSM